MELGYVVCGLGLGLAHAVLIREFIVLGRINRDLAERNAVQAQELGAWRVACQREIPADIPLPTGASMRFNAPLPEQVIPNNGPIWGFPILP